ncbi:hypothetical protein [Tahibacter caeni]|uniref:hypothetical protein n=1 Tax=Tahibacter caeni TaxID=1453545 RepID=UPI002147A076|nr:hypothetical protein [Tahibacter caeni]
MHAIADRRLRVAAAVLLLVLAGCSRQSPSADAAASAAPTPEPPPAGVPVPDEEPSEAVLRKLEFERYDELEAAGGLPVTSTATGNSITLHPTLHDVRKDGPCKPMPHAPTGWYECSLIIRVSISADGGDPSEQGERIGVKWDAGDGKWVRQ